MSSHEVMPVDNVKKIKKDSFDGSDVDANDIPYVTSFLDSTTKEYDEGPKLILL